MKNKHKYIFLYIVVSIIVLNSFKDLNAKNVFHYNKHHIELSYLIANQNIGITSLKTNLINQDNDDLNKAISFNSIYYQATYLYKVDSIYFGASLAIAQSNSNNLIFEHNNIRIEQKNSYFPSAVVKYRFYRTKDYHVLITGSLGFTSDNIKYSFIDKQKYIDYTKIVVENIKLQGTILQGYLLEIAESCDAGSNIDDVDFIYDGSETMITSGDFICSKYIEIPEEKEYTKNYNSKKVNITLIYSFGIAMLYNINKNVLFTTEAGISRFLKYSIDYSNNDSIYLNAKYNINNGYIKLGVMYYF